MLRSSHPQISFVARGAHKAAIIEGHTLDFGLGEGSPLARLYDLNGWVLLLGVGHRSNTSLHLAEYRAEYPSKRLIKCGAPVMIGGRRKWVEFQNIDLEDSDFYVIGESFIKET